MGVASFKTLAFAWLRGSMLVAYWRYERALRIPLNKVRAMRCFMPSLLLMQLVGVSRPGCFVMRASETDGGSMMFEAALYPPEWQDINFTTGTLQVLRVLTRVPTKMPERQHVYVEAETKTKNSRRSVIIAPFALKALKEHRVHQLEAKLKAGASWQEHDYVFCTLHGTHLGPNHVVEEFKLLLKQAGLPDIRFHDLRHSARHSF